MDQKQRWQQENLAWRNDHGFWLKEVDNWSKQTQRLSALLHKLEHALPEQTKRLQHYVIKINEYNAQIRRYECGLHPNCIETCESYISPDEQRHFHQKLATLHQLSEQQHADFSSEHKQQLQEFRDIVQKIIQELEDD